MHDLKKYAAALGLAAGFAGFVLLVGLPETVQAQDTSVSQDNKDVTPDTDATSESDATQGSDAAPDIGAAPDKSEAPEMGASEEKKTVPPVTGLTPDIGLRDAAEFDILSDGQERAVALFGEIGKVLTHPRCVNCHPRGDSPLQGDAMKTHQPPVRRGEGGIGVTAMRCATCHGSENVAFTGAEGSIPGHPKWHLAPAGMAWEGKSLGQICTQIKDVARNGGRTMEEMHEHVAKDTLVGWAWKPGEGRKPAPGTQDKLGRLFVAWLEAGAHCPSQ